MDVNLIREKIKDIKFDLENRYSDIESIALLTGASGALVFYYLLYMLEKNDDHMKRFEAILDDIYERLNTEDYKKTYCDGLAGVAFVLEFFRQRNVIKDEDIEEALEIFDEVLLDAVAAYNIYLESYDLLHGAFGALYYLTERVSRNHLLDIRLSHQFEIIAKTIYDDILRPVDNPKDIPQANCGLSHGTMSYIIVFTKFLEKHPENKVVKECLIGLVNHQLKFMSLDMNTTSLFPGIVNNMDDIQYNTVLGWCYGDQTVAIGLFMAGTFLKDDYILSKANIIAAHTAKRNTVILSSHTELADAGLCHGMSGVAMCNRILFNWTQNSAFMDNYFYFIDKVLERGNHASTPSGFRKYLGKGKNKDVVGFLDGTIGIGVFLISTLLEEDTEWERFFLLK